MQLEILQVTKTLFGQYEVEVSLNGKKYEYIIKSEYDYNRAMNYYRKRHYGKCINALKGIK